MKRIEYDADGDVVDWEERRMWRDAAAKVAWESAVGDGLLYFAYQFAMGCNSVNVSGTKKRGKTK